MTFSINEAEGRVVNLIHDQYEEIRSLVRLDRMLNKKGYRSRAGGDWSSISIHIILQSIFYIDSIVVLDGWVKTIVFRSGPSHTFVFRQQTEKDLGTENGSQVFSYFTNVRF